MEYQKIMNLAETINLVQKIDDSMEHVIKLDLRLAC